MARIPMLDTNDTALPPPASAFLQQSRESRGRLINLYRALANRPEAGQAFMQLVNTVYRGRTTLEPKHAELAYFTATVVNDCFY